jgi:hypothetical protein
MVLWVEEKIIQIAQPTVNSPATVLGGMIALSRTATGDQHSHFTPWVA